MNEQTETFWGDEIQAERERQDAEWGGPEHDDQHTPAEWLVFIQDHINLADMSFGQAYRRELVKIAALAVAALQSFDRLEAKEAVTS